VEDSAAPESPVAEAAAPEPEVAEVPEAADASAPIPAAEVPEGPGRSSIGIWAFVLSVLGLVGILPVIGSVLGLVLGWVALRRTPASAVRGGRGLAMAAVIIGLLTLVLVMVAAATYALVLAFGPA